MKQLYKITGTRTITGTAYIMAESEDEAVDLAMETNFTPEEDPEGFLGLDCDNIEVAAVKRRGRKASR